MAYLSNLISTLRYDVNDVNPYTQYFSDLDIVKFIMRGLYDVNIKGRVLKRQQFISVDENIVVYPLNKDFIQAVTFIDKYGYPVVYNKLAQFGVIEDYYTDNIYTFIDETNYKLYFNANINIAKTYDIVNYTNNLLVVSGSVDSLVKYYSVNYNGETFYVKIFKTEYDKLNNQTTLYVTDIYNSQYNDVYVFPQSGQIKEISFVLTYVYNLREQDYYFSRAGFVLTANSATVNISDTSNIAVGDLLFVENFGSRTITAVTANTSVTVDLPFSQNRPAAPTQFLGHVIHQNAFIPLNLEILNVVIAFAKYYALLTQGDQTALTQYQLAQSLLQEENARQVAEVINKTENRNYWRDYEG